MGYRGTNISHRADDFVETVSYVIPTLLGTRMGFGIAAFMILWKYETFPTIFAVDVVSMKQCIHFFLVRAVCRYVVALLPFDNVWFFVSPQLIFFLYDLVSAGHFLLFICVLFSVTSQVCCGAIAWLNLVPGRNNSGDR